MVPMQAIPSKGPEPRLHLGVLPVHASILLLYGMAADAACNLARFHLRG